MILHITISENGVRLNDCIARGAWPRRLSPPRALTVWNGGTKQVGGPLDPNGGSAVHRVLNEEWVANLSAAGVKLATMDTYVDRNDNLTDFEGVAVDEGGTVILQICTLICCYSYRIPCIEISEMRRNESTNTRLGG